MKTLSRNRHVRPVGSETEKILLNSRAITSKRTTINEVSFAEPFALARLVDSSWWDDLEVLSKQAVYNHIKDHPQHEGIDEGADIPKNELVSRSGYAALTQNNVCCMMWEPFLKRKEDKLSGPIGDRCKNLILNLFQVAQERAIENVYKPLSMTL